MYVAYILKSPELILKILKQINKSPERKYLGDVLK